MSNKATIDAMFDYAIKEEGKAAEIYTYLAGMMKNPEMARIFREFAVEERGHKAKLQGLKGHWKEVEPMGKVIDMGIADYVVDAEISKAMDYQNALIVAMKQEKAAFKMYSDLAAATTDPETKKVLLLMAQEEAKHKLRFEVEYEETFMPEA